jgi:hypothetical protein
MKRMYQQKSVYLVISILLLSACVRKNFSSPAPTQDPVSDGAPVDAPETPEDKMEAGASADAAAAAPGSPPSEQATEKPAQDPSSVLLPQPQAGGLPDGHFDFDTSIDTYEFKAGTTVAHVHEYDDAFNVTGVDMFNLLDPKLVSPGDVIDKNQSFKIIVANAQLSPGARITINGQTFLATDWQKRSLSGDLPVFSLSGAAGTQKLTALAVAFDPKKSISKQLIPTETSLVRSNAPGPGDSYRAGALTIQMIDAKDGQIDANLGVAKIGVAGMLWESTLFWHQKAMP